MAFTPSTLGNQTWDRLDGGGVLYPLVAFDADRQAAFPRASDDVPDGTAVFGFVYDSQGVYGSVPGRTYLVNTAGETELGASRDLAPDGVEACVRRLL